MEDSEELPLTRLMAASYALPVEDVLRDLADDVASWDAEGMPARDIDSRIRKWGEKHGFGRQDFIDGYLEENPGFAEQFPGLNLGKVWHGIKYEEWLIECVRSLAFEDEPIPFHPMGAGFWYEMPEHDPPLLIAVMTPLSDPDLGARQMKEYFGMFFGAKAARSTRRDEVENARMLAQHRRGMSYRAIAIQNLRGQFPDIIQRPAKYKKQLEAERSRVAKAVSAAEALWKERLPESSTDK